MGALSTASYNPLTPRAHKGQRWQSGQPLLNGLEVDQPAAAHITNHCCQDPMSGQTLDLHVWADYYYSADPSGGNGASLGGLELPAFAPNAGVSAACCTDCPSIELSLCMSSRQTAAASRHSFDPGQLSCVYTAPE